MFVDGLFAAPITRPGKKSTLHDVLRMALVWEGADVTRAQVSFPCDT